MKPNRLKLVTDEPQPPTTDEALRLVIREYDAAMSAARACLPKLKPLMRSYADERGEKLLPTLERLRREVKP